MLIRQVALPACLLVATILVGDFLYPSNIVAAECPPGTRPATASDAAVRNGQISVGRCYKPDEVAIGQSAEEAKNFLLTRYTQGGCSAANVSKTEGIMRLNDDFATRLAKMLKAAPMNINILSAYRSPKAQRCANPKVTNSNHTKGLAVDMGWDQNSCSSAACQWILKNGPTYGIWIRMKYAPEWNHLEPTGAVAGGLGAGTGNDSSVPPPSQLSDQIRRALGMQPPPPPQPPLPPQPQLPAQPQSQSQTTLPAQPTLPAQTTTSSEYPQVKPVSDIINTNTNTSNNTNTNTKSTSTATSTWDLIDAYLNPVSDSIDIGKAVDIALNPDTSDATALEPGQDPSRMGATGTLVLSPSVNAPQTFTSSDLAKNPIVSGATGQNTFVLQMLETMKNTLLLALNYLRPFGGRTPGANVPYSE